MNREGRILWKKWENAEENPAVTSIVARISLKLSDSHNLDKCNALAALLNDSNTKDNTMINRRGSLVYCLFLESLPPYGLSVYLIECLCSVFRHYCSGWWSRFPKLNSFQLMLLLHCLPPACNFVAYFCKKKVTGDSGSKLIFKGGEKSLGFSPWET